jgi:hypothetical protein
MRSDSNKARLRLGLETVLMPLIVDSQLFRNLFERVVHIPDTKLLFVTVPVLHSYFESKRTPMVDKGGGRTHFSRRSRALQALDSKDSSSAVVSAIGSVSSSSAWGKLFVTGRSDKRVF